MSLEMLLQKLFDALRYVGIPLSEKAENWTTIVLAGLVIFVAIAEAVKLLWPLITRVWNLLPRPRYSPADKAFVDIRNVVVQHLIYEVERLNREADWNDFYYTALEAKVEVDPALTIFTQRSSRVLSWFRTIWSSLKGMIVSPTAKPAKDLVHAIMRSTSRAFLVIGAPGSGKTVSLRHLFLRMAKKSVNSTSKSIVIPLYLNLKHLNISPDNLSANAIHKWVIEQLQAGQDRTIFNFLKDRFGTILAQGNFFFIFDSFDEIPAVMDAYEEDEVVRRYAKALDDFLHGPHRCRGLVCSRPYRAPKVFMGQKMEILPLSPKRVKQALERYFTLKRQLAQRVWHELVSERDDLLHVIHTPFYLALLVRYVEAEEQLPERHYELFEEFATMRATEDEERLVAFVLTPDELLAKASQLAFAMTDTPNVGLETTLSQAQEMLVDWESEQVQFLVDALHYSKLGRVSPKVTGEPQTFSFVHRRFQEYFAARYLRQYPMVAPFEDLVADNRWREVLVLLCEVLPIDQLDRIIDVSRSVLAAGVGALSGTDEHRQAIETLRFLKDGFHSRLEDVPHDIRTLAAQFIECQFERETLEDRLSTYLEDSPSDIHTLVQIIRNHLASETLRNSLVNNPPDDVVALVQRIKSQLADGDKDVRLIKHLEKSPTDTKKLLELVKNQLAKANLLDQKRAVESIILADEQSAPALLETALNVDSDWVQETALRSCRVLTTPSEQILRAIRRRLRRKYFDLELFRDFSFYRVLFSSPAPFAPLLRYTWMLGISGLVTVALCVLFGLFFLMTGGLFRLIFFFGFALGVYVSITEQSLKDPRTLLLPMVLLGFGIKASEGLFTDALVAFGPFLLIVFCPSVLVAYLASDYPSTLGDWVLLPFQAVIKTLKVIVWMIRHFVEKPPARSIAVGLSSMVVAGITSVFTGLLTDAASTCGYSLQCLYDTYHPIVATLIVSTGVAAFIFVLLLILGLIYVLWLVIRTSILVRYLALNPNARPTSAIEAVERLRAIIIIDSVKIQYIRALRNWLPISSEWHIFIEEANRHEGVVRDELYKLAELWQDSETGSS